MTQLFKNNASGRLSGAHNNTVLTINMVDSAVFPVPAAGEWYLVTMYKVVNGVESDFEIIKVTANDTGTDQLTVVRNQEGSGAKSYVDGDYIGLRFTAGEADQSVNVTSEASRIATLSSSGTDSYAASCSPALNSYTNGQIIGFIVNHTNVGSCTLNIDGISAKSIVSTDGISVHSGALNNGSWVHVYYNGTNFVLFDPFTVESKAFSPTVIGSLVTGSATYSARVCSYSVKGKIGFVSMYISLSSKGGMDGTVYIDNMPFSDLGLIVNNNFTGATCVITNCLGLSADDVLYARQLVDDRLLLEKINYVAGDSSFTFLDESKISDNSTFFIQLMILFS